MITKKLLSLALLGVLGAGAGTIGCKGRHRGGGGSEQGPDCETEFDKTKFPDAYQQCQACVKQHRGMGTMEADCKSAIAKPWK